MNYASTLAFIPSCFISLSPPLPQPLPSSFSLLLAEVTHEDNFIFIHVLIHVKSSLNPLPGNCSFCVLVITHANTDDNISLATIVSVTAVMSRFFFFQGDRKGRKGALQQRRQNWMHCRFTAKKKAIWLYSILRHQYWVYTISSQFA